MAVNPARNIQFRHYLRVEGDPEGGIHLYFGHQHSYWNPYGQFEQRLFPLLDGSRTCDEIIEKMQLADPTITPDQVSTYLEVMQYPDDPDDPNPGPGLIEYAAPGDAGLPLSLLKEMDRHLAYLSLRNRTGEGGAILQRKLRDSHVTIIGLGGLGSSVVWDLVRIGVRHFRLVDHDTVERSNLMRGRFAGADVDKSKTQVAYEILKGIDETISAEVVEKRIAGPEDIIEILQEGNRTDLVVLTADEPPEISRWMNEAAFQTGIPFVTSGYQGLGADLGPLVIPGETDCLPCVLGGVPVHPRGVPSELDWINKRSARRAPSDASHTSFVASRLADAAQTFLIGQKPPIWGKILVYHPNDWSVSPLRRKRPKRCDLCGRPQKADKA